MGTYFRKFGSGWLIVGFGLMLVLALVQMLSVPVLWPGRIASILLISLIFAAGPFIAGYFGFTRFFAWIFSWCILYFLGNFLLGLSLAPGGNSENIGSPLIFTLPVFLLIGIADEIRCHFQSRRRV